MEAKLSWARDWVKKEKKNFVGGEWQLLQGARHYEVRNPSTEELLCALPLSIDEEIDSAVRCANEAYRAGHWRRLAQRERAQKMHTIAEAIESHQEELATLESLSNGKLFRESMEDDLPDCSEVFRYYAGWIDKFYAENCPVEEGFLNYTTREPMGVCALIVPWNFPLLLACWKIAPALAMGNTIVIKPSEQTSFSLLRAFEIIHEKVDLPPGTLNLVLGDGESGQHLAEHKKVHKLSFTGSTVVGKKILQAAKSNLKSVTLELGGKSPNIFFDDTPDLQSAVDRSFHLMFSQKGEKCSEPTRFFVHRKIYDEVLNQLVEKAKSVRLGDPFDPASNQGPQCHEKHFEKVCRYVELGKKEGAQLIAGGQIPSQKGYFVPPTIFAGVDNKSSLAQEEIFGPVLCVMPFETENEVIQKANESPYGLAAGLWTQDVSRAHRVADKLDAGMVFINRYGCYAFSSPFGGFKQSGWGKEMAIHSLEAYTKTKSIWLHWG